MTRHRSDRRPALRLVSVAAAVACTLFAGHGALTQPRSPAAEPAPANSFDQAAKPFVAKYCVGCHGPTKQSGGLSLAKADPNSLQDDRPSWELVRERLTKSEMPPKKKPKPSDDEKKVFLAWLDTALAKTACTGPIEPGRVTLRR